MFEHFDSGSHEKSADSSPKKYFSAQNIFDKKLYLEEVIFKDVDFEQVRLLKINFRNGLTFIRCQFLGKLHLSNITSDKGISFIDCTFNDDVQIYGVTSKNLFQVINSKIDGLLTIDSIITKKLDLTSGSASNIKISSSNRTSEINSLLINNFNSISIEILDIGQLEDLKLSKSRFSECRLKKINGISNSQISIIEVRISELTLEKLSFASLSTIQISRSIFNNLIINDNQFKSISFLMPSNLISEHFIVANINHEDLQLDFSTSTISKIEIDSSLYAFIHNITDYTPLLSPDNRIQRSQTFKILMSMFRESGRFDLQDKCFYKLKTEETLHKISLSNFPNKYFLTLLYLMNRYMLGWGVQIKNVFLTSALFLLCFSFAYYYSLNLYNSLHNITYMDKNISGFSAALITSAWSFFGMQSDIKFPADLAPIYLLIPEFIAGILLITIIVAMLIRKLIR